MTDGPEFEQVFGCRQPTADEVERTSENIVQKVQNDGLPTGTMAFFSVPELQGLSMEIITGTGTSHAEEFGIDPEQAVMIAYAGFISALELVAGVLMQVRD